ncbi:MAG TPA: cysteine--tRNA ligase [Terriglobales bacterium]|nr:cysteine--tRNA ligase [Terriglobales bacterium]
MAPHFYNTLSGRVEEFHPLDNNLVRMYACGPTVYDYGHIGNFRTFIFVDILRRFLRHSGYQLRHMMNITDVDDKIIRNASRAGVSVGEYTKKYEQAFLEDADALNIEHPEILGRATEHINEMAAFIAELEKKGFAYRAEDGSYYFRIAKDPEYGKLSKKDFSGIEVGARVDVDEYEKDNARDFALWKAPKPGEAFWETPIGPGRPGWHIECSTMSMKYLGESFDIHCGGEDLIFPHHENEIAQSESLTGKPFAHFWMHARFLLVEGEKMSKSLGNFYTLRDLILMGHKPSSIRYLLSSVPYRRQLNFTFDGLTQAANAVERLRNFQLRLGKAKENLPAGSNEGMAKLAADTISKMHASLADDLNTAQALAAIFDLVRDANATADAGQLRKDDVAPLLKALENFDAIFDVLKDDDAAKVRRTVEWARAEGLADKISPATLEIAAAAETSDSDIEKLVNEMQAARKSRNFARSDAIRGELNQMGIIVEITKDGVRWRRK